MTHETSNTKRQPWLWTWSLIAATCGITLAAPESFAFKIVSPAEGAALQSGQTITAAVDLGSDSGILKVPLRLIAAGHLTVP